MNARLRRLLAVPLLCLGLLPAPVLAGEASATDAVRTQSRRAAPRKLDVNAPRQESFETGAVQQAALTPDGTRLALARLASGYSELWLRGLAPGPGGAPDLPVRLAPALADRLSPALSPDGRWLAFVGLEDDVTGDIYLLDLARPEAKARKLTGRGSEDGAPCFAPDGRSLYFQQRPEGERQRRVAVLDLTAPEAAPRTLDTGGDASSPALSPDGRRLAFVSARDGRDAVYVMELPSGAPRRLTSGVLAETAPCFGPDGAAVFFVQSPPQAAPGLADPPQPVIARADAAQPGGQARAITSARLAALAPRVAGGRLYFLSPRNGPENLWSLPLSGEIPGRRAAGILALADEIAAQTPVDRHLAALAYGRAAEAADADAPLAARALYAQGRQLEALGMAGQARNAYEAAAALAAQPESGLAAVRLVLLREAEARDAARNDAGRLDALRSGLKALAALRATHQANPRVARQAALEQARLLLAHGGDSRSLTEALRLLDAELSAQAAAAGAAEQRAEALYLKAEAFARIGQAQAVLPLYAQVIANHPEDGPWADLAVSRVLDQSLSGAGDKPEDRAQALVLLADRHRGALPKLSLGALNRMGDVYYAADEWTKAKDAYRQTLATGARLPQAATQVAAARLALAEILYREERFHQALDLYESEMASRPYEDRLYRLAKAAHLRKSVAAGDYLLRLGEVPAARAIFAGLLRDDPDFVPAHRGLIRASAALRTIPSTVAEYRAKLAARPGDPTLLYATGLALTYLDGKGPLLEGRALVARAIQANGQVEYFHQTLGYMDEVLETAHGERGRLEAALESYQRARFLNSREQNPENAANLDLNIGNAHFLLGQYADAFEEYRKRQDAKIPFDNEETEIVFHQRLGVAAFQARERTRPAEAFARALELVERRIQPRHASEVFGRIGKQVFDRVLTPALSRADLSEDAKALARRLAARQSDLNNRLFEASAKPSGPPPDPAWNTYVADIRNLLAEQERLVADLAPLLPTERDEREAAVQTYAAMAVKVREALGFPPRFVQLRAELYDRLGLARQETGDWRGAREAFEQALALNTGLGLNANLTANQRSVAYNAFMEAGLTTGLERDALLDKAEAGFRRVPELAAKHGVADKKGGGRKKGLINLDIDVALDKGAASQAAYGFSAAQEQRIAEAFLARIATERGRPREALGLVERQSARFEKGEVPPQETFGAALLLHRAGLLENALGREATAFERFRRSAGLALDLGNAVSASVNVADMSAALAALPAGPEGDARQAELRRLEDRAALALRQAGLEADSLTAPAFHNRLAAGHMALADRLPGADAEGAARRMELYARAGQRLAEGLAWFAAHPPANRRALGLNAALRLNQAGLALRLGEDETRARALESALVLAERGLLPGLRWRALAGLERLPEALAQLEALPLDELACGPGEILRAFAPLAARLLAAGKVEDAFNLLERLGELERVGRMGGMGAPAPSPAELPLLRRSGLRLLALRDLQARLAKLTDKNPAQTQIDARTDLNRRMGQEQEILARDLGPDRALLPAVARLGASREEQDWLLLLYGLSAELAARAEAVAAAGDAPQAATLRRSHAELAQRLAGLKAEAARALGRLDTPGLLGLLVSAPAQAVDLMEALPRGASALRLALLPGGRWAGIRLDADSLKALDLGPGPLPALPAPAPGEKRLLLFEAPELLPRGDLRAATALGLSGTHMARSLAARKPFRRNLLFLASAASAPRGFELQAAPQAAPQAELLPRAHTLVAGAPVRLADTAPSRQDELPVRFFALAPEGLEPADLSRLAGRMRDVSLAVLPRAAAADAYHLAQLLALQGVPAALLPMTAESGEAFVPPFLAAYAEASAADARARVQASAAQPWLLLGDPGLGLKEAAAFAATQFARYVRSAIAAAGAGRLDLALSRYDNALRVIRNTGQFKEREPELLEHMRKAAFDLGDYARAEALGRELLALQAKARPDSQAHAAALLGLGSVLAESEKFPEAVKLLEQGLEMIQNLELTGPEIDALVRLGATLEKAVQYDKALGRFEGAARLSRKAGARELLAQQYMRIGRILDLRLSQYARAKAAYAEALALYTELGRAPERLEALLNLGRCARLLGGFAEADARYAEALKLAGSARELERQRLRILLEQANNAWQQARYQEAFDLERRVLKGAEQNGWVAEQVMARNTAGLLWWSLGDHERALRELEAALPLARSLRIRQDEVATTLNNRGLVERDMGRPELALKTLGEALDIDRGLRSRWAVAYDLRNLAQTHLRLGDAKKALPLLDEALAHAEAIGDGVNRAKVLLALGEAQLTLDARDKARDAFAKADALAASLGLRDSRWRALHGLARLELATKNLAGARALLEQAAELIEGMRAELKVDQLKDGFMADRSVVYEDLALLLADQGEVAESFRTAERSRSRNLMDLLGNKRLNPRSPEDRALYQRLEALRGRMAEQETLLAQAGAKAERDVYGRGLKQAQDEYRDTLLELQARRPDLASLVSVSPLSLPEVQRLLEPGVVLLAYYVTGGEVLCWTVSGAQTSLTRIPIGREALGRMVLTYRRMLQNLEPLDLQSRELHGLLLAPVLRTLPADVRALGIIPHDALHTLSFPSLSGGAEYLVDRLPLFQLPSASVFRFTLERRKTQRNTRVLAVGNPDLRDQSLELPFAEREVGSLAWNYPGMTSLTREKATKDWITRHIGDFGIIHLATHGEFDPVNPLFSALKLAGVGKQADGDLEAGEIFDLSINADLIVLSACQTGLGKVSSGDEVQGLNQAFLFAGTHALVSSLWRVSDISTAMLMKQFYREYQTRPKAESLRRAMLHVKTRFPHPGYWAAFTLTGDYK